MIPSVLAIIDKTSLPQFVTRRSRRKQMTELDDLYGSVPEINTKNSNCIDAYLKYKNEMTNPSARIDKSAWNDLDMEKVFNRVNYCITSIGEEYLYDSLHEIQLDDEILMKRDSLADYFAINKEERLTVQMCLKAIGKFNSNGLTHLIFAPNIAMYKFAFIFNIFAIMPFFSILGYIVNTSLGFIFLFLTFFINLIIVYKSKLRIDIALPIMGYVASIITCCGILSKNTKLQRFSAIEKIQENHTVFKGLAKKLPRLLQGAVLNEIQESLLLYIDILFLRDLRKYNHFANTVIRHRDELHELYKALGEIELAICISSFRKSLPVFSKPIFHDNNSIEFVELYHPLLKAPIKNTRIIKNDSIITGSNASGKSTFIKSLAINCILSQTLYTCTAEKYILRHSHVLTAMAIRDDISNSESYFVAEIKAMKRIIDLSQQFHCICFIDEILRGTNSKERVAASIAILEHLNTRDGLCIVATHDIDIATLLDDIYDNYHFREHLTDNDICFDYKIRCGISSTRNAIKLLELMGFNANIVHKANELS